MIGISPHHFPGDGGEVYAGPGDIPIILEPADCLGADVNSAQFTVAGEDKIDRTDAASLLDCRDPSGGIVSVSHVKMIAIEDQIARNQGTRDRKSTRLNSSHR